MDESRLSRRPLVLGWGNSIRGDDGFGPWVVDALLRRGLDSAADLVAPPQLAPEHADAVARASRVVFIDASRDLPPGRLEMRAISPCAANPLLPHRLSPEGLLALAERLHGAAPPAMLICAGGETFEFGEGLSETTRRAAAAAVARVESLIGGA